MAVKSETKGVSISELDAMFDVTEDKKKNMASFTGKPMLKLPAVGDKKGLVVRPLLSDDGKGNKVPVLLVKSDSPKMVSEDKTMKLMTVEDYEDQGTEYTIPYNASLHYGFTGIVSSHGWRFEDIFGKWYKITADEYANDKAPSGIAKGYRVSLREDLNRVVQDARRAVTSSQF